jgi:hypothetical protein
VLQHTTVTVSHFNHNATAPGAATHYNYIVTFQN